MQGAQVNSREVAGVGSQGWSQIRGKVGWIRVRMASFIGPVPVVASEANPARPKVFSDQDFQDSLQRKIGDAEMSSTSYQ